jgi:formimidoylglutamate deiminase
VRLRARYVVAAGPTLLQDAVVETANGVIVSVGHDPAPATDLGDVVLLPGQVNAHSHAFQRAIRGRTEFLAADHVEDDFWSWRTQMYAAANALDPDGVEAVSRMAFLEMALAGVTSVGEFHYLHHAPDGSPYADPNELAHRVIRAARDVGLRITLLRVAYHSGGMGVPAGAQQRRFVEPAVETFLERAESLAVASAGDDLVTVGLAPHSIRAVPRPWLEAIARSAAGRPVHIHACEQRAEIDASVAAYGAGPVQVLDGIGFFETRATLVHATHLDDEALAVLARTRPTVCACPTTERNLGDGFLPASALLERAVPVALGSDSQAVIDPWVEMRLVETHARLRAERRNVLAAHHGAWFDSGERLETADLLWPMGTTHGAESLGIAAGEIAPGKAADFVTLDLHHPALAGTNTLAGLVFAAAPGAVREVYVAGERIVQGGRHPLQQETVEAFTREMAKLW